MNLFEMNMLRTIQGILRDFPTLVTNHNLATTEAMYYLCYFNLTKKFHPARVLGTEKPYYILTNRHTTIDITDNVIGGQKHTMPFPTQEPSSEAMLIIDKVLSL